MNKYTKLPTDLPQEFRGVSFDDDWEFDIPTIIYQPIMKYLIGGGGEFERGVEDYLIDLQLYLNGAENCNKPKDDLSDFEYKEFAHRGWSIPGLPRRKNATHWLARVNWKILDNGELDFDYSVWNQWGERPE